MARYAPAELYEPTEEQKSRHVEEIRAVTGGEGVVTVSFAGRADVNGTWVETEELMGGLPVWRQQGGSCRELYFEEGHWTMEYYRQRFDPASPAPKQEGWEKQSADLFQTVFD